MISRQKRISQNTATYAILTITAVLYSLPTLAMVGTAFKGDGNAISDTGLFAKEPTLSAFQAVLSSDFMHTAYNSLKVGLIVTLCCVVLAALAGYALSRFKSKLFSGYLTGMLVLQMFPLMLRLIPLFIIFKGMGIQNTHLSLILSYTAINLPFSIMLLKGFFDTISIEIEESAMIDGCGRFQCLVRIVLPLAGAGLATVAIFTFLNVWNEYTFANVLVNDPAKMTLTVGLQKYMNKSLNSWGQMMAASTVGMLPSVLFLLFAQRYIVQGMLAGSVKG